MADLKVTLAGVEHTAPAPRVAQFKAYLKFLRAGERARADGSDADIDEEFVFIGLFVLRPGGHRAEHGGGTVFFGGSQTAQGVSPMADAVYAGGGCKNGKAGKRRRPLPGTDGYLCGFAAAGNRTQAGG